jgi:hypothetical protein
VRTELGDIRRLVNSSRRYATRSCVTLVLWCPRVQDKMIMVLQPGIRFCLFWFQAILAGNSIFQCLPRVHGKINRRQFEIFGRCSNTSSATIEASFLAMIWAGPAKMTVRLSLISPSLTFASQLTRGSTNLKMTIPTIFFSK